MTNIAPDVPSVNPLVFQEKRGKTLATIPSFVFYWKRYNLQISQNAFDFVEIDWHPEPLECFCNMIERNLVLFEDFVNAFEEISIADSLTFLQ